MSVCLFRYVCVKETGDTYLPIWVGETEREREREREREFGL